MQAVRFSALGEPAEVLRLESVDVPSPGPGEVRVRMLAAAVNPADLLYIRGQFGVQPELPATPGFEGVGVVEDGRGLLARILRGKRVAVPGRGRGTWAEQVVVPARQVIPVGRELSDEQAACFFINPATAWAMANDVLGAGRGDWLLQTAASSSVGRMLTRLGRVQGFHTICVVRREAHVARLKEAGADEVIVFGADSLREQLVDAVQARTGGGVRFAVDAVGGSVGSALVDCLGPGGRMLVYGTLSGQPLQFSSRQLMKNAASVAGFWLANYMNGLSLPAKLRLIRRLNRLVGDGTLASEIGATYALGDVRQAVLAAQAPGRTGRILLRMDGSA